VVRRPHLEDLGPSLSLTLQFAGASLSDVMQARLLLESSIARGAALHISDEQIVRLRALDEHLATAGQRDEHEFVTGNAAYHALVAEACGNVVLRIFLAALSSIADGRAAGVRISAEMREAAACDHVRITDALAQRDPEAAERAMRAHLAATHAFWVRDFEDVIARPIRWVIT
jgi:GntR family transcriptional repressor for pyruvate dehydrogenase complex